MDLENTHLSFKPQLKYLQSFFWLSSTQPQ